MNNKFKIEKGRIFNHRDGMSELKIFEEQIKEKDMNDNSASTNHGIDDTQFGITNVGTDGIQQIPLELKDHTNDPALVSESVKTGLEQAKEGKLLDSPEDFSKFVTKKKRGRPSKKYIGIDKAKEGSDETVSNYYCATCREHYSDKAIMKMGAGDSRYAAFCPNCTKFLSYVDEVMQKTVKDWADNNPTGK